MQISNRLMKIASMIEKCESIADIGTDHGYIPIYLIKKGVCQKAIASDINKGPVEKVTFNVQIEGLDEKIECRMGNGLETISENEVQVAVIAGMGGNLIKDILNNRMDVFKSLKYAVLEATQNPEVLRKYLYDNNFKIIDEELCLDEGIFYEIIKVSSEKNECSVNEIDYEISPILIQKKHPLLKAFIEFKINKYERALKHIELKTESAVLRKKDIENKIASIKEISNNLC